MATDSAAAVRALFEAHPSIMWIADGKTRRFLAVNAAACRRYGFRRAQFLAMTLEDLLPPGDEQAEYPGHIQRHMTRSGEVILVEVLKHRIEFQGRRAELAVVFDVTAQARRDAKLRTQLERMSARHAQAEHAQMTAERLVAGYSRLVGQEILPLIARLHGGRPTGDTVALERVLLRMQRLEQLAAQPVVPGAVDMEAIAEAELDRLRETGAYRKVHVEISPDFQALGDPAMVQLLLQELLDNAWKFTGRAATPWIRAGRIATMTPVPTFYVSDNGTGFDDTLQSRMFQPFQRLHSAAEFPGAGLGLALARAVVNRHGGRIWAEAEPGRGATFCFELAPRPPLPGGRVQEVVVDSLPGDDD